MLSPVTYSQPSPRPSHADGTSSHAAVRDPQVPLALQAQQERLDLRADLLVMRGKDAVRAALDKHHLCAGDGIGGSPGLFIPGGRIGRAVDDQGWYAAGLESQRSFSQPQVVVERPGAPRAGRNHPFERLADHAASLVL